MKRDALETAQCKAEAAQSALSSALQVALGANAGSGATLEDEDLATASRKNLFTKATPGINYPEIAEGFIIELRAAVETYRTERPGSREAQLLLIENAINKFAETVVLTTLIAEITRINGLVHKDHMTHGGIGLFGLRLSVRAESSLETALNKCLTNVNAKLAGPAATAPAPRA
jgi:hypothetical protein